MEFNNSVIMTISGIRYINGEMILDEIGDIHHFSNPNKLLAFAGLDPSVYQSGNFQTNRTRMSKRGSRVLRYALVNAAHNVVKNNATSKLTTTKRWQKTEHTIMLSGTAPTSLSESFGRCSLTESNLTSIRRFIYQYR